MFLNYVIHYPLILQNLNSNIDIYNIANTFYFNPKSMMDMIEKCQNLLTMWRNVVKCGKLNLYLI